MKIQTIIVIIIIIGLGLNVLNYEYFHYYLSIVWYLSSIMILYLAIKYTIKYKFKQFNIKKIFQSLLSKSNNDITPISSLSISLAAKIGVGSLSGIALAIFYGGIGTIFWIVIISLLVSINAFVECKLGIKYRERIGNTLIGGPSYYIKKCLNNKILSYLYSILVIIGYSAIFLSIQTNTIIEISSYYKINNIYIVIILVITVTLIIIKGLKGIDKVNNILVPIMIFIYLIIGIIITINNIELMPKMLIQTITMAFKPQTFISVFLIGMQRAIFITESSIGTSAISASTCDNSPDKQGLLEVFGIYITIFIVCLTTFIIIVTSNYNSINLNNINGIEIVLYALNYHFGNLGSIILSIITFMFAYSTIISSYYFGESNLTYISKKKYGKLIFKIAFIIIIIISSYIKPNILWNLIDFLVAILAIINTYAIIRINK